MSLRKDKLTLYTIGWCALTILWPLRPDPLKQIVLGQTTANTIEQGIILVAPYLLLVFVLLAVKIKWVTESLLARITPFVLGALLILDVINSSIRQFSATGSFLSLGIVYLVALWIARWDKSSRSYFTRLSLGGIVVLAASYLWEAIYQLFIYSKAHFTIHDNITFFMSAIVILPLTYIMIRGIKLHKGTVLLSVAFLVTLLCWIGFGGWTYVAYDNGWYLEKYNYFMYALTRVNKIALLFCLGSVGYKI